MDYLSVKHLSKKDVVLGVHVHLYLYDDEFAYTVEHFVDKLPSGGPSALTEPKEETTDLTLTIHDLITSSWLKVSDKDEMMEVTPNELMDSEPFSHENYIFHTLLGRMYKAQSSSFSKSANKVTIQDNDNGTFSYKTNDSWMQTWHVTQTPIMFDMRPLDQKREPIFFAPAGAKSWGKVEFKDRELSKLENVVNGFFNPKAGGGVKRIVRRLGVQRDPSGVGRPGDARPFA